MNVMKSENVIWRNKIFCIFFFFADSVSKIHMVLVSVILRYAQNAL